MPRRAITQNERASAGRVAASTPQVSEMRITDRMRPIPHGTVVRLYRLGIGVANQGVDRLEPDDGHRKGHHGRPELPRVPLQESRQGTRGNAAKIGESVKLDATSSVATAATR